MLVCGAEMKSACMFVHISAYMHIQTYGWQRAVVLLTERMNWHESIKKKFVIIGIFHIITLVFLCSFCSS